jgi:hypothetical protein
MEKFMKTYRCMWMNKFLELRMLLLKKSVRLYVKLSTLTTGETKMITKIKN